MATVAPEISDYLAYEIKTAILYFKDREQPIQSGEISSFSVGCNYDGHEFFPEFSISLTVDRKTFFDIMREKDTLTMLLRVDYYTVEPLGPDREVKGRALTWFNEKFVMYMDDKHYDTLLEQNKAMQDEYRRMGDDDYDIPEHKEYNLQFFIYKEESINTAYSVVNEVWGPSNRASVVAHLLNQSKAKNVLMSPPAPGEINQATAMPMTLIANLRYLEAQYGIHTHGTLLFFDLDYLYILNKKPGCTAWRKGEYTKISFIVRKDTDEKSFMGGSKLISDEGVVYINVPPENISYKSYSAMDNIIYGGEIQMVAPRGNGKGTIRPNMPMRKAQTKYFVNKNQNPHVSMRIKQQMQDRGMVATMTIADANIHWFRPNKDFSFTFMNQELQSVIGGPYKILNIFMKFTNFGGYFRNESTMQYTKSV